MNKIFITVFGDLTEAQALYRCAEVASEGAYQPERQRAVLRLRNDVH